MSIVEFGGEAILKVKEGIDLAAQYVGATIGPRGRNIILKANKYSKQVRIINDGVKILRTLETWDDIKNTGIEIVKSAAEKTNDNVGDGTTTTAILTAEIIELGLQQRAAGKDAVELRNQIDSDLVKVIDSIKSEKQDASSLESLKNVASISCGNDQVGSVVAEAIYAVGVDGLVTSEDSYTSETTYEKSEGMKLSGGLISPFFITNQTLQQAIFDDALVMVTDQSLTLGEEMLRIMQQAAARGKKQCVVIASDITAGALAVAVTNAAKGVFNVMPVRVVGFGAHAEGYLRDVCAVTGATFISPKDGRKVLDFTEGEFGQVNKVVAGNSQVLIIGGTGDKDTRIEELKVQLEAAHDFDAEVLRERIAKMKSAVCVIRVGAVVDTERDELRERVEDAINSTRQAFIGGVVAGGGSALYRASEKTDNYILKEACKVPMQLLAKNSSIEYDKSDVLMIRNDTNMAIDFNTGKTVNAFETGILDPLNVVVNTIENAAKTAASFLTSEGIIVETDDTSEKI